MSNPVIEARELTQIYPVKQGLFRAPAQLQAVLEWDSLICFPDGLYGLHLLL